MTQKLMHIDEFVREQKELLDQFRREWKENYESGPAGVWPLELPPGEWDAQFVLFDRNAQNNIEL